MRSFRDVPIISQQTSILCMGVTYRYMGTSHSLGVDKERSFYICQYHMKEIHVRWIFILTSIILLICAAYIYISNRSLDMMLYSWLGIDTNNSLFSYIRRHTFISASWVKYNLVDGLWLLSFLLLIEAVWNKDMKRKMTFMLPVIAFAFASEVFQYMGLISGTGDIWDTIF